MAWLSLSLQTRAEDAEQLCDALLEAGALSACIEDADAGTPDEEAQFGEPGTDCYVGWKNSKISALLNEQDDPRSILEIASKTVGMVLPAFTLETVAEQNWVERTQAQFDPIQISARLWIVPSWHQAPDPEAINLTLDPGMAFGTGSHPTTRLCLEWLERTVKPGESLLDYGCGSGVLAIAGAKLGAGLVKGVDIDPQAVTAARANAERNHVTITFADNAQTVSGDYDRVVANILSNPLKVLAPAICALVKPGGELALSGILEAQADEVMAIYRPWMALHVDNTSAGWVCLSGSKPQ